MMMVSDDEEANATSYDNEWMNAPVEKREINPNLKSVKFERWCFFLDTVDRSYVQQDWRSMRDTQSRANQTNTQKRKRCSLGDGQSPPPHHLEQYDIKSVECVKCQLKRSFGVVVIDNIKG